MPISASQLLAFLGSNNTDKAAHPSSSARAHPHQKPEDPALPSFVLSQTTESVSLASHASSDTVKNGQLIITSLSTFSKYFHPRHGLYRDCQPMDRTEIVDDGLPIVAPEDVEWLIVDLRFVVGDQEWDTVDSQLSPKAAHRQLPPVEEPIFSVPSSGILFPNAYKLSLVGAEYVESTLNDERAKALSKLVLDRLNPREIMEVEWLTAADQDASALTLSSHLVHPAIIEAGKKWSNDPDVNPSARRNPGDDAEEDDVNMEKPIGNRGEDIGLRCLRIQGGFPMPNPSLDDSTSYALKPDFSFAFKDWIKGGVETLIWSFKGNYSDACSLSILRHLLKYFAEYYASHSSLPCSLLILQDLKPDLVKKLRSQESATMRRCGADDFDTQLKVALSDMIFAESEPTEAGARIIERLWTEEISESGAYKLSRALRRLRAELVVNDRAYRRLTSMANISTIPPKLLRIGSTSHTRTVNPITSPMSPLSICSPLSTRSQSYASTRQDRSSHSDSTASLNTLGDAFEQSAIDEVRISAEDDLDDVAPGSSELPVKPLPPISGATST